LVQWLATQTGRELGTMSIHSAAALLPTEKCHRDHGMSGEIIG